MPFKLKITYLEDNSSIHIHLRKRTGRSVSDIGRNINNQGQKNNEISTCNYGDDERSNFWFWYEYDVAPRDNPAMPYNYECGKEVYNYEGISSYNYRGNVPDKGPYYDVGVNNQILPYNCGNEVYNNYGGATSYNYGGKVPEKGPYYDVGVNNRISPYNCGNEVYNDYRGISSYNYGGQIPEKGPYYDVGVNNQISPYNYECGKEEYNYGSYGGGNAGIISYSYGEKVPDKGPYYDVGVNNQIPPYNYECGKEVYNYGGGNAGITSYNYGRNVPEKGPYYDVGVSAYNNCGKEVYNYGGVTSYNYGRNVPDKGPYHDVGVSAYNCGNEVYNNGGVTSYNYGGNVPDKGPYYDVGVNNQISPYQYGNKSVSSCNYQCTAQISPNCYSRGIKGDSPSHYQGEIDMRKSPMNCPPKDIPRITRLKCKRKCCKKLKTQGKDLKIKPMTAEGLSKVGPIAKKYLKKNSDFIFGIHFDKEANAFKVGRDLVMVDGNDLVISFEEEVMRYTGTEGLWRLITQDMSYFDEDYYFSDEDWVVYMELLLRTNYHQCSDTVAKDEDPENITPMFLCCLGLGAGGVAVGGAGGLAVGGAGGLAVGGAGGLVVGGAVGGTVGFVGGVGFTLATLLGLKFAANLGKVLTSALYTVLSKKANFIAGALGGMAQAGVNIYGKIGQLKDGIYDALKNLAPKPISWGTYLKDKMSDLFWGAVGKIVPISPGGGPDLSYLKFWEWFKCPTCILFKELDELLRLLISLQKPETSPNKQCGFNQNCLLFWILERIVACFGKEGGCEKLIDWLKINVPLIISSGLLRQLIENLPWGYQQKTNPICGPQTKPAQQDKDCSNQGQRYRWYLDLDIKLEAEVRVGVEVMDVLFKKDPQFFEKIEGSINLPCKELNEALKSLLQFLKNYFQIESGDGCLI